MSWHLWVAWVLIAFNLALVLGNAWLLRRNASQRVQLKALADDLEILARELVGPPL